MFEIYNFSLTEIYSFILVLIRISVFFFLFPFFSMTSVPAMLKILFSVLLTMVIFPTVGWQKLESSDIDSQLFWLAGREALVGFVMGGVVRMFFQVFEMAGQLISDAMGLGAAQILNPTSQVQSSVVEQFVYLLMVLFFFGMNGHHLFLIGLTESFQILPIDLRGLRIEILRDIGILMQGLATSAAKMAAPVVVAIFLVNVGMAIVGRAVPQINVLITSIPVTIYVGILIMAMSIPLYLSTGSGIINDSVAEMFKVLKAL